MGFVILLIILKKKKRILEELRWSLFPLGLLGGLSLHLNHLIGQ